MSELLNLYRDTQIRYEKFVRYWATAQVGILPYYDMLLDQYSEADQIFVKRVLELEAKYSALTARIAELEAERERVFDLVRELRTYCIFANWDNPDTEDDFNEFDVEVCKWLSKYMECEE